MRMFTKVSKLFANNFSSRRDEIMQISLNSRNEEIRRLSNIDSKLNFFPDES